MTKSVLKVTRLITLSTKGEQQTFDGITWTVPNGVDVASDVNVGECKLHRSVLLPWISPSHSHITTASYNSYSDGTNAASSIEADASLAGKYMAVEIDVSANYSISKTFNSAYQYALFSFNQNLLQVGFEDWGDSINEDGIIARLKSIPDKFDPGNPDVVNSYRRLFKTMGSHIITGASYGGRFQLVSVALLSPSQSL